MTQKNKSHDEFILAMNNKTVDVMFSDKHLLTSSIDSYGNEKFKDQAKRLLKFKKSGIYVWSACVLTLFTPLRILFLFGIIFMAAKHFLHSTLKSYIIKEMKGSEEFYLSMLESKIVHLEFSDD